MSDGRGPVRSAPMLDAARRRVRQAARDPGWALRAANTRMQWQRWLGWEPPEFRALARDVLSDIEGWRFRQDLALLYLLARDVPGPGVTVEIGSFKGLASTALAFGVRHGDHEPVHTVDPHTGDRQDLEAKGAAELPSADAFRHNIDRAGVANEVVSYTMTSDALAAQWSAGAVRVLFVDGWHSYDAVSSDLRNWAPLLTPDGVVLIDDYANYPDVRRAVQDNAGLLPAQQRPAGRMWLAHARPLSQPLQRFLRIPWG